MDDISLDDLGERRSSSAVHDTAGAPRIVLTHSDSLYTLDSPELSRRESRVDDDTLALTEHAHHFSGRRQEQDLVQGRPRSASPMRRKMSVVLANTSQRVVKLQAAAGASDRATSRGSSRPSTQGPQLPPQLSGKSFGLLSTENWLRQLCFRILTRPYSELLVLAVILLHAVILTIDSFTTKKNAWGDWTDWVLLGIFTFYSVELVIRIIVSGAIINPELAQSKHLQSLQQSPAYTRTMPIAATLNRSREDTLKGGIRFVRRAFLRKSANRFDLVCVCSFWASFILSLTGIETTHHFYMFRVISSLRIIRLLNITEGTATILQSLRTAAPLLGDVAFFIAFFWVFVAIIGVQAFKGSFRRHCVWVDPIGTQANVTTELQFCGGHYEQGIARGYLLPNWQSSLSPPKGYTCPEQSFCVQGSNPYSGTVSFDTIWNALELVFVIISSNTSTDLMYSTMDSDHFVACLFFIFGTLLLTFWLVSLFIAVVTNSFSVIREEQRKVRAAARAAEKQKETEATRFPSRTSAGLHLWRKLNPLWLMLIVGSLVAQASKTAHMTTRMDSALDATELAFTIAFAVEIIGRFCAFLPNWRAFNSKSNLFDLFLVVVTCLIQLPPVKHLGTSDEFYRWMTIFQVLRVYRLIRAVPFTQHLLLRIVGDYKALLNLLFFVFCSVLIGAILASQLIRGEVAETLYGNDQEITFKNIYNSFIGMYQVMSTENWTNMLYSVQDAQSPYKMAWLGAIFLIVWFIYAQFVMMSLFISVLSESLEVSEEDKRREQVKTFVQRTLPSLAGHDKAAPALVTILKKRPMRDEATTMDEFGSLMNSQNVQAFLADEIAPLGRRQMTIQDQFRGPLANVWSKVTARVKLLQKRQHNSPNPFSNQYQVFANESLSSMQPHKIAEQVLEAHGDRRMMQIAYLKVNPSYDYALWILRPDSLLRSWCQSLVAPSYGERLQGHPPSPRRWYAFSAFTYACTLCIVISACMVTPIYQKVHRLQDGQDGVAWYTWLDLGLTLVFTFEAVCKVFADGFCLTPNAYLRNTWNRLDFLVLCTLWINFVADVMDDGSVSRAFRAFKALRALRLVNISDKTKEIFHDVLIAGFWNILGAAVVALALLIPTAIWAQNMFSGLLFMCNDSDVADKAACVNEFLAMPSYWSVLMPRQWDNPRTYSFDSFGAALLTLFEIVSQEGWTAVATSAAAITGPDQQPRSETSSENWIFFIIFNISGAVFVLTLFIAVILQNYSERSGLAFLTTEQRSWQEIKLLLGQVRPSRRPADAPKSRFRRWAFFAVKNHSIWQRFMLGCYIVHSFLLMTEHFPSTTAYTTARNTLFFVLLMIFVANIVVRIIGLGWSLFIRSRWNLYNLVVLPFAVTTSILTTSFADNTYITLQKVSLVLLAMNLIHAVDSLDTLAKVAVASLPALASLVATWIILFITFAIAFNQILGLTKLGLHSTHNYNFRTVAKGLVSLYRMSLGEGWNAAMHDYTVQAPYCTESSDFYQSDCGSPAWAYGLFLAWNCLSMYVFVNIVLSLVFNNFSYVFQRSGVMGQITREQLRQFKQAWARFDDGTGHISRLDVGKFLHSLQGVFEVKIYPTDCSVQSMLAQCCKHSETRNETHLDLVALKTQLVQLDIEATRRRRAQYECIYTELQEADRIPFHQALLVIAYNKFVEDGKSLQLLEFFRRREVRNKILRRLREPQIVHFIESTWFQHKTTKAALSGLSDSAMLSPVWQSDRRTRDTGAVGSPNIMVSLDDSSEDHAIKDLLRNSVWSKALAEQANNDHSSKDEQA